MSVNNAPGEVDNKDIFDSPNISGAEEETTEAVDKAAEEQKKRETVDIDGVPIDEKDIKYKAEDIRKKKKMKYFVNVEGEKEREKAEAKKQAVAKRAVEKMNAEAEREVEREEKAAKAAEAKKQAEEEKQIKEVEAFVKKHAKEQEAKPVDDAKKARSDKRKLVFLGIIAAVVVIVIVVAFVVIAIKGKIVADKEEEDRKEKEYVARFLSDPANAAISKLYKDKDLENALDNYHFDQVKRIYAEYLKDITDDKAKAYVYLNMASRISEVAPTEYDEIIAALEKARDYAPEDTYVLSRLRDGYDPKKDGTKRAEVDRELNRLMSEIEPSDEEGEG